MERPKSAVLHKATVFLLFHCRSGWAQSTAWVFLGQRQEAGVEPPMEDSCFKAPSRVLED